MSPKTLPTARICEHEVWIERFSVPPAFFSLRAVCEGKVFPAAALMVKNPPGDTIAGEMVKPLVEVVTVTAEPVLTEPEQVNLPDCGLLLAAHPPPVYWNVRLLGLPAVLQSGFGLGTRLQMVLPFPTETSKYGSLFGRSPAVISAARMNPVIRPSGILAFVNTLEKFTFQMSSPIDSSAGKICAGPAWPTMVLL